MVKHILPNHELIWYTDGVIHKCQDPKTINPFHTWSIGSKSWACPTCKVDYTNYKPFIKLYLKMNP